MRLNALSDRPGATKARKRLGRGIGSGLGKTAGKGTKGQKARAGVAIKGFEGGQMPLHRRLPKRGFKNIFARKFNELNLGRIQQAVDSGLIDGKKPITVATLKEAGLIRRTKDGVRLLGQGDLTAKLAFEITGASQSAIKAVEAKGGTITLTSITGRERPPTDKIKSERRAAKRAAKAAPKGGKAKAKAAEAAQDEEGAQSPAKEEAPAKAKAGPEAAAEAPSAAKKPKPDEGEAAKPKANPAKKDKSE
jgi:large subunit ribosomal protein L15